VTGKTTLKRINNLGLRVTEEEAGVIRHKLHGGRAPHRRRNQLQPQKNSTRATNPERGRITSRAVKPDTPKDKRS